MFLFKPEVDAKALLVIYISTSVVTHHDRGWCLSTAVGLGTKGLQITPHAGEAVSTRLKRGTAHLVCALAVIQLMIFNQHTERIVCQLDFSRVISCLIKHGDERSYANSALVYRPQ